MDKLRRQALEFLQQEPSHSVLATPEEQAYFSPRPKQAAAPSKEQKKTSLEIDAEMKQWVATILPEIALTSTIPNDDAAKKMAQLWKEHHLTAKIIVLSFGETGPALQFLQNVAKAIDALLAPSRLVEMRRIEKENSWELLLSSPALQLVVAPPFNAWKNLSLSRFYRENPSSKTHFLRETPLLFMHPPASYLKNPDLKRELWKTLSSLLSTST